MSNVRVAVGHALLLGAVVVLLLAQGCKRSPEKAEDAGPPPPYAEHVEIAISLGPAADIVDINKDSLFFTVNNGGDKTITELSGEIVFADSSGREAGRSGAIFLRVDKTMEKLAVKGKKARWRPLPAGETLEDSVSFLHFLAGQPALKEVLSSRWEGLSARAVIKNVVIE